MMQTFPRKAPTVALVMIVLHTFTACGKVPETPAAALSPASRIDEGLSLSGQVTLTGGKPAKMGQTIDVGGNPFCTGHGQLTNPAWRVSSSGGLADVVISIQGSPRAQLLSEVSPLIDQHHCEFQPYLTTLQVGQSVRLHNSDLTFHNIRIVRHREGSLNAGENLVNLAQPSRGNENVHSFNEPGIYRLECDVHRWMRAWVFVHEGVHVTATNEEGQFRLNRVLSDGEYVVTAWHPEFPSRLTQTIVVQNGRGQADFQFDLAKSFDP